MKTQTVTVETGVSHRKVNTKHGEKDQWSFKADGMWFQSWKHEHIQGVTEGALLELDFEEKPWTSGDKSGVNRTLLGCRRGIPDDKVAPNPGWDPPADDPWEGLPVASAKTVSVGGRDASICRQTAGKAAAQVLTGYTGVDVEARIISLTELFSVFFQTGRWADDNDIPF